ncbi:hypothetical protein [Nonomuraea dietziae]|uniref:hypothetical protein n=1 Tax=Nonomuraea dietziae TaxID=65515 RepID=UPI0031D1FCF3
MIEPRSSPARCWSPGATAADAQTKPTLGPDGYGAVKLGMTVKQAKTTGDVVKKRPATAAARLGPEEVPDPQDSVGIYISPRRGTGRAIFAAKGMRTPEGIKIGSTVKQVKAALPAHQERLPRLFM